MREPLGVSGHRVKRLSGFDLKGLEYLADVQLRLEFPDVVYIGMALGWDTFCARVCVRRKIPFVACIPFRGQEKFWLPEQKKEYKELLSKADEVVYTSDGEFANWKFAVRNQFIVNHVKKMLVLWDGERRGGTASAVTYAEACQVPIVNVWKEAQNYRAN